MGRLKTNNCEPESTVVFHVQKLLQEIAGLRDYFHKYKDSYTFSKTLQVDLVTLFQFFGCIVLTCMHASYDTYHSVRRHGRSMVGAGYPYCGRKETVCYSMWLIVKLKTSVHGKLHV